METRASYAIIGVFTIAVITAAFGFVYWMSGSERGAMRTAYKVEFQGSVAGLTKGAPVLFNGIRVGEVMDVYFDRSRPEQAFARIEVQPDTPVKRDTKASLDVAILSGVGVIALRGGSGEAGPPEKKAGDDIPTIEAERGGIASLLETARSTAERANDLLDNVNGIVTTNRDALNRAVRNVEAFSDALGRNAPGIDKLLTSVGTAADRIGPVAQKLEVLTDETTNLIRAADPAEVRRVVKNIADITQTVGDGRARLAEIMSSASGLVTRLNEVTAPKLDEMFSALTLVAENLNPVAAKVSILSDEATARLRAIDPQQLNQIIANANRFSEGLSASTPDLQATLRNANQLSAKLSQSADKIDAVLQGAQNFLGSASGKEGQGTFESVRLAADAFRAASENLNRRATEIAQGVSKLAGTGSKQLDGLGTDARRTVNDVGRAVRSIERNPSSVIFGGSRSSLPEYGAR